MSAQYEVNKSTEDGNRRNLQRRAEDAAAFQLMQDTKIMVKELEGVMEAKFDSFSSELFQQRQQSQDRHDVIAQRIDHLSTSTINALQEQSKLIKELQGHLREAFVNGDFREHREEHQIWNDKQKADKEFWLDIKKKAYSTVITGILVWAGVVLWAAFVNGPK